MTVSLLTAPMCRSRPVRPSRLLLRRQEPEVFAREWKITERWNRGIPIEDSDVAKRYFASRGLDAENAMNMCFHANSHLEGAHPAILALVHAANGKLVQIQSTHLKRDGSGKADIVNPRRFMHGPLPAGSAVRLYPAEPVLGIAEGIETAMSAAQLYGIPVWAALAANNLARWTPPKETRAVVIFADNDANRAGQIAAKRLAARLAELGMKDVQIRVPKEEGTDWNDVLVKEASRIHAD